MRLKTLSKIALATMLAAVLSPIMPTVAAGQVYVSDTDLPVDGQTLKIMAGSQADSLAVSGKSLTVTVAANEVFVLRYPGGNPLGLENDMGQPACNVLTTRDNQLIINGPRTTTVTVSTMACSTANYSSDDTPLLSFIQPTAGAALKSGETFQLFWQLAGHSVPSIRIRLSTDGGLSYHTVIADGLLNNGFYSWVVPDVTTSHARLKLEGRSQDSTVAMTLSQEFSVQGTAPAAPAVVTPPAGGYVPEAATSKADSISTDRGFAATTDSDKSECVAGLRIKAKTSAAVYFCGADGKRHAFPNQKIHDSWYAGDFAGVYEVQDSVLARIALGRNVTYRPGVRMVKVTTDPKVYAVDANGTLRWIKTEAAAARLYGADWNQKIDDLPDAFFFDYVIGEPVE